MERLEKLMFWGFGLLAWMSVALSSFHTQDQQLAGYGGFDTESCKNMIFFGYLSTSGFCVLAWLLTKELFFLVIAILVGIGGYIWTYRVPHPILRLEVLKSA